MSDGIRSPEILVPQINTQESSSKIVSRRWTLKAGIAAAGAALLGIRPKRTNAQEEAKPVPGYGPDKSKQLQGEGASRKQNPPGLVWPLNDPASKEAQAQEKGRKFEELAVFEAKMEQLSATSQKALSPNVKPMKTTQFTGSEKTSAWGYLDPHKDGSINPSIVVQLKDASPGTLDMALVLVAEEAARIINDAYDGEPSRKTDKMNSDVRNNLSESDALKAGEFFERKNFVKDPKVEIEEHGGFDIGTMIYTAAYGLLRTKSTEVIKKLEEDDLSPQAKEGIVLIFLTALKSTTDRLRGQISPHDLGFNEEHIAKLIKMGGDKINFDSPKAA